MVNCRAACPSEVRGLMENNYGWGLNDRFGAIRNCNLIIEKMESSTIRKPTRTSLQRKLR